MSNFLSLLQKGRGRVGQSDSRKREQIDLPYENYFDCVIFADVLEHLVDPWRMLRRAKILLRRDGVIVASIPNVQHSRVLIGLFFGRWEYEQYGIMDSTHLRSSPGRASRSFFSPRDMNCAEYPLFLGRPGSN